MTTASGSSSPPSAEATGGDARVASGATALPGLRSAFALLTRLRVADGPPGPIGAGAATGAGGSWFGVVGATIGVVAAAPLVALSSIDQTAAIAAGPVLVVATIALASGALHLDGVADTADALAAPNPDLAERARRDPATGPAGVVAIVLVLALEVGLVAALTARLGAIAAAAAVVVAATASRSAAVVAAVLARVKATGFGAWFAASVDAKAAVVAAVTAVAVGFGAILVQPRLGLVAPIALAFAAAGARVLARRRRGLDGDAFGALVELDFAAGLLVALLVTPR